MDRPDFKDRFSAVLAGEPIAYTALAGVEQSLKSMWMGYFSYPSEPKDQEAQQLKEADSVQNRDERKTAYFPRGLWPSQAPPELFEKKPLDVWLLGFSKTFYNAVREIDRKLQGRILEALAEISRTPISSRGDTVKALSGEMKGLWRYRIGDFRLVYLPDEKTKTITLYDFASRGSVYD